MRADGTNPTNLSNSSGDDSSPIWQPVSAGSTGDTPPAEAEAPAASEPTQPPASTIVNPITADNAGNLIPIATIGSANNPISNASIAFSSNSQYLAYVNNSYSANYALGVWDLVAGQDTGLVLGSTSGIQWLGFSGTDLTTLAQSSTAMFRWSVPSKERLPYHSLIGIAVNTETALSPDWKPDGGVRQ